MMKCLRRIGIPLLALAAICGCQSPRYHVWERPFQDHQKILRASVETARDHQERLSRQSQAALDQLSEIANAPAARFDDLFLEYRNQCWHFEKRAKAFSRSLEKLEMVARDYFASTEAKLETIEEAAEREREESDLEKLRRSYEQLRDQLRETEAAIPAVVDLFNEQVALLRESPKPEVIEALGERLELIDQAVQNINASLDQSIFAAYKLLSWIPV